MLVKTWIIRQIEPDQLQVGRQEAAGMHQLLQRADFHRQTGINHRHAQRVPAAGIDQAARPATIQRKTGAGNAPGAHQAAPP